MSWKQPKEDEEKEIKKEAKKEEKNWSGIQR